MTLDMQVSGMLTLVLSSAATSAALVGWWLLRRSTHSVGQKMARYLLIHAALFIITMCFGLAAFIGAPHWIWHTVYHARVIVLGIELVALISLVDTFYRIQQKPD